MASTLDQKREELEVKGRKLHDIFTEAGKDLDMSKVTTIDGDDRHKAAEIKRLNDEMSDLGKEVESLAAMKKMRDDLAAPVSTVPHPTTSAGETQTVKSKFDGKTVGDLFIESAAFKQYNRTEQRGPAVDYDLGDPRTGGVELKTLLDRTGFVPFAQNLSLILPGLLRRPVVADLIPQGTTNGASLRYQEETTTTNAVAAVAEGATKPEAALAFTAKTATVEKIAGILPVTDELFDDVPAMRSYIEQRLRLFLQIAEENALLNGTGTTPQIRGLLNVSGINTQAKGADSIPDAIYKAMVLIRINSFLEPTGLVIHPQDWQKVRLLTTSIGNYIFGSPADPAPDRIWGMPVVQTTAATAGTALTAAFDTATQIFRRNQVSFAVSDQHASFFITNQLMLRVEERLALVCYRPKGVATITGI